MLKGIQRRAAVIEGIWAVRQRRGKQATAGLLAAVCMTKAAEVSITGVEAVGSSTVAKQLAVRHTKMLALEVL